MKSLKNQEMLAQSRNGRSIANNSASQRNLEIMSDAGSRQLSVDMRINDNMGEGML